MKYFFTDYNWIEQQVFLHEKKLKTLGITHIFYISRGGLFPAHLASQMLGINAVHPLYYDRPSRNVSAVFPADFSKDSRVLLCEDVAGDGLTLSDCLDFVRAHAGFVKTLTICSFKGSRIVPDFSCYTDEVIGLFPWERHTMNDELRATYRKLRVQEKKDFEYFKYGSDLDGIFLPDMPAHGYQKDLQNTLAARAKLPPYPPELHPEKSQNGWHIITARPEEDRQVTEQWLAAHNIHFEKLMMRDASRFVMVAGDDPHMLAEKAAAVKIAHIKAEGITHFYESESLQAILIAAGLPMTRVYWWDNHQNVRKLISASTL